MKLSSLKAKGLFTCRIDLGGAFEGEAENPLAGQYVMMRELTTDEQIKIQNITQEEYSKAFEDLLPALIVESSFEDDTGEAAKPKDVADMIIGSSTTFQHVLTEWSQSLPFVKRMQKKSEMSAASYSGAAQFQTGSPKQEGDTAR